MKRLDITLFLTQLKPLLSKPGLKKKGREKGRVWIEIQCNIPHLAKKKKAFETLISKAFAYLLFNFCKHDVFTKFW